MSTSESWILRMYCAMNHFGVEQVLQVMPCNRLGSHRRNRSIKSMIPEVPDLYYPISAPSPVPPTGAIQGGSVTTPYLTLIDT
jgi:hypothetical protein